MEPSARQLNPFVRDFTRKTMKIPVLKPIEGCSWPGGNCETRAQKNLIESSTSGDTFLGQIHRYSLKSLERSPTNFREESEQCAVGPEFQNLFGNRTEIRTVADAFTEWVAKSRTMTRAQKQEFSTEIIKTLEGDIQRRTWTLGTYVLYFSITLFLLLQQYQQRANLPTPPLLGSPILLLILFAIPMVAAFYLQTQYSERLRTAAVLHILPILLITTYAAYSVMISQGSVTSGWKYTMMIAQTLVLVMLIYVFLYLRKIYDHCYGIQTGSQTKPSATPTILITASIALPILITLGMTYNL